MSGAAGPSGFVCLTNEPEFKLKKKIKIDTLPNIQLLLATFKGVGQKKMTLSVVSSFQFTLNIIATLIQ